MGVSSWVGVGGFGVCVVLEWVWFWVVYGWKDVGGWGVWMVMGVGVGGVVGGVWVVTGV